MKFVRYERKKGDEEEFLHGLEDREGNFYEAIEFNEFKEKPSKIPNGFRKVRISSEWVLKYFYDPGKTPLQKDNEAFLLRRSRKFKAACIRLMLSLSSVQKQVKNPAPGLTVIQNNYKLMNLLDLNRLKCLDPVFQRRVS